jgi:hypothetical protein
MIEIAKDAARAHPKRVRQFNSGHPRPVPEQTGHPFETITPAHGQLAKAW